MSDKVKVRFLKDVEWSGKTFLKNTMIETYVQDNEICLTSLVGASRRLSPVEVTIITGKECFDQHDLDCAFDHAFDVHHDTRKDAEREVSRWKEKFTKEELRYELLVEKFWAIQEELKALKEKHGGS